MRAFCEIPDCFVALVRRALYFWVRTTVFVEDAARSDTARPVCYVLDDGRFSNLLILLEESRRAGLAPAEAPLVVGGVRAQRSVVHLNRQHDGASDPVLPLLTDMVRAVIGDPAFDIQLVPVLVLWGRAPDKQESILNAHCAASRRNPGILRQLFAILVHGRQTLVRFTAPLSLRELVAGGPTPLAAAPAAHKVSDILRAHLRRRREMAIGPDLARRNTQIGIVLTSAPVRRAIAEEAARLGISPAEAGERAQQLAREIASDYSYGTMRALESFVRWLFARLYDGIEVHNVASLARIAPGQSIVYIPCHRSHIDYLLLSYLIHRHGLTPPHVAAGVNLNMPLVGSLLRRAGAFFLRRSFKGEPLYSAVFQEYLHLMLVRGFPIEYFIEGGRSRSGRTLAPKTGILGMTIASYLRGHDRPLVFVPVYLGYERLLEGETYVRELAGRPKQRETVWSLLATACKIRRIYGRVHVNFGEPLALADILAARPAGGEDEDGEADAARLRAVTRETAQALTTRINDAAVLNPVGLIALALPAMPRRAADALSVHRLLAHLQALDRAVPYSPRRVPCTLDPAQVIEYAERLGIVEQVAYPAGNLVSVVEAQAPQLAYFRNNVLHLFALPALIACLLGNCRHLARQRLSEAVAAIYGGLRSALFLRWSPPELPEEIRRIIDVFSERGLVRFAEREDSLLAPAANSPEFAEFDTLGAILRPLLGRYFLVLAVLQACGPGKLTRAFLASECRLLAQRLAPLHVFGAGDAVDPADFSNLIATLLAGGLLGEDGEGLLDFDERLPAPLAFADLVLPADACQSLRRIAGQLAG